MIAVKSCGNYGHRIARAFRRSDCYAQKRQKALPRNADLNRLHAVKSGCCVTGRILAIDENQLPVVRSTSDNPGAASLLPQASGLSRRIDEPKEFHGRF
jgi:hypothetical protein